MSISDAEKNILCQDVVSKTSNFNELIQYVKGSVVSRTIIDKSVGTVTLFAFDEGQGLSEHQAPYDALVQVVDGAGIFTVGGDPIEVGQGGFLIMPANIPHSVKAEQKFMMLLTMIRQES